MTIEFLSCSMETWHGNVYGSNSSSIAPKCSKNTSPSTSACFDALDGWMALASSHFGDANDAARIAMPGVQSALNDRVVLQGGEAPPHLYSHSHHSHRWLSCWTWGARGIESKQRGHDHWLLVTMRRHISHLHVLNLSSQLSMERKSCKLCM